ncbi:MAG: DedA family protein [Chitinophagaceae bacterium]|nr:MAG: DedA family protein [Chitinophagaceae bacterium]
MVLLFGSSEIIAWGGVLFIAVLIFAETGLLLGLVVPGGETLIFTSGVLVSTQSLDISLVAMLLLLVACGYAGDCSGYLIGKHFGERLYQKKDSWFFRKKYVSMAADFLGKHRIASLLFGKFLPVFRPFVPVMSGVSNMKPAFFYPLSFFSVSLYMSVFLLGGYFLGRRYPEIKNHLGWILPASIAVLLVPVLIQIRKNRARTSPNE